MTLAPLPVNRRKRRFTAPAKPAEGQEPAISSAQPQTS
jgi:hypothetical protein